MTGRELLELAAKAIGKRLNGWRYSDDGWFYTYKGMRDDTIIQWSPLNDDGDAMRLAVQLGIPIMHADPYVVTHAGKSVMSEQVTERIDNDPCAATRRAIVRAAAKIGEQK